MRLVLAFLLAFPALAQLVPGIPDAALMRPPLPRAGLVAGWDLRTVNLLRFSEDFSNAAWNIKQRVDIAVNDAVDSSGAQTAEKLTVNAADGFARVGQQNIPPIAGAVVTFAVDIKRVSGTGTISIRLSDNTLGMNTVVNITPTESWVRYTATGTVPVAATQMQAWVYLNANGDSGTPTLGDSIHVARAQLNQGPTPLPYVATGDLQTVANLVPGGPALQRGSASGADTNDPTPTLAGWSFDGVDDYAAPTTASPIGNLAASTVVFCSSHGVENIFKRLYSEGRPSGEGTWSIGTSNPASTLRVVSLTGTTTVSTVTADLFFSGWTCGHVVRDGATIRIYKNGVLFQSGSFSVLAVSFQHVQIGRRLEGTTGSGYYAGSVGYVFSYSRALNASEVKRHYERFLKPRMAAVGVTLP